MSKKTSFLKKLFNRVDRAGWRRRKSQRSEAQVEQLEKRIALAVDVVTSAEGGAGEDWLTVLVNDGSDVYLKMDATPTNDLLIADNASFQSSAASTAHSVEGVDERFDSINIYNGSLVAQQVKFPNDTDYSADFGLLPRNYPFYASGEQNADEKLAFLMNDGLETWSDNSARTATIELGDIDGTVIEIRKITPDPDDDDGREWEIVGSNAGVNVTESASQDYRLIEVESSALAGAGTNAMPIMKILDPDQVGEDLIIESGVVPDSDTSRFKLFNEITHGFVPGALNGELVIHSTNEETDFRNQPISFQVDTAGTGVVPISFGNDRDSNAPSPFGGTISGRFNTETGEIEMETDATGVSARIPIYLDNIQIGLRDLTKDDDATDVLRTKFDNVANDLTVFPGSNFTRSIIAELPNAASEISIENPLIVAAGTNGGLISLSASKVSVHSGVRAAGQFVIPSAETTTFGTSAQNLIINAPVGSPSFDVRLGSPLNVYEDGQTTGDFVRSELNISRQGSFSNLANILDQTPAALPPANQVYLEIEDGDAFITGSIVANEQSYVMRSGVGSEIVGPYVFTTASNVTGVQAGEIAGQTLSMLLANDTLGRTFNSYQTMVSNVDIQTSIDRLRMQAASRQGHSADFPFPYDISVRESDDLIIDAVSASSGKIDIEAVGSLTLLSSVNSMGDIKLQSGEEFVVSAPVSTSFGSIDIRGPQVNVANSVRINGRLSDPNLNDISIEATDGPLVLADAVVGINGVKLAATGIGGSITGEGRVIGDTIGAESTGDIVMRTDANGVSVRTPGIVRLEDRTSAAFETFNSPDVSLTAEGLDDVVTLEDGTESVSPALYADITGALKVSVSAPLGSIDVLHSGTTTLELGDGDAIASGVDVGVVTAGGSVVIRSTTARDMLISDAPSATSGAATVRFMTSEALPVETLFETSGLPGTYPTFLTTSLKMNTVTKEIDALGGVKATDIKYGDLVLVKDGKVKLSLDGLSTQVSDDGALLYDRVQLPAPDSVDSVVYNDEDFIDKIISGSSFAEGTTISSISVDNDRQILILSTAAIAPVLTGDAVNIFDSDANYVNGIYGVESTTSEASGTVEIRLKRSIDFDTTNEVSGRRYVRVTDGAMNGDHSSVGKVFVSKGFSNDINTTSRFVKPVLSGPGFITANAISTQTIPAIVEEDGSIRSSANGAIGFDAEYFDGVVLGNGRRVLIQSPLTGSSTTSHYGVYEVESSGDSGSEWRLSRYSDIDGFETQTPTTFQTGKVAITQGSLRTAVTGMMYEVGYDSLNNANLEFEEITDFRKVADRIHARKGDVPSSADPNPKLITDIDTTDLQEGMAVQGDRIPDGTTIATIDSGRQLTLSMAVTGDGEDESDLKFIETGVSYVTEDYDDLTQYRTDIGTRNIFGRVTYQISSEAGINDAPSSLGRMLQILQGNTATIDRIDKAQLTETTFHDSVQKIQLDQELPEITSPIVINPSREIIIDGSRINLTRDGAVVRSGALRARLGPASPWAAPSARRLTRGAGQALNFDEVNGLEIDQGGSGSIIGNLSIGGFSNGAGISIAGADNVLLNNVNVGLDVAGNLMPNRVGIDVIQIAGGKNARFTTVRNSVIAANTEEGISLGTNVDGVRIVGSEIGQEGNGNETGVLVDTGESGISRIGVRQVNPTFPVVNLSVTVLEYDVSPDVVLPLSRVSVAKSLTTESFEPGLQLFERSTNQMWTVRTIDLSPDKLNYFMEIEGFIDSASFGSTLALEAGYFVDAPQRAETLRLPPGVDPARLYLGQGVASTVAGVLETGTYITSITVLPPPEFSPMADQRGYYSGGVEIGLSSPIAVAAKTGVLFEAADRNVVGFNNDGVILKSGSSSIVSTDVTGSNFDGIRIEGVAERKVVITGDVPSSSAPTPTVITNVDTTNLVVGMTVTGANIPANATISSISGAGASETITISSPVIAGAGVQNTSLTFIQLGRHTIGGARGIELTSESVTINANLVSGLSFMESFFAELADDDAKQKRMDQVKIRGNVFGTDLASTPNLSNGRDGASNLVISDSSMAREHQEKTDRDSDTNRYAAKYRPEDNPQDLPELEEFEGFDTEGNNFFTGDPITIIVGGTGGENDYYSEGPSLPTPPTLR